jgi:uncharacterized LabA/DUF88 family protein
MDYPGLVDVLGAGHDVLRSYFFDSHRPDQRESKEDFYTFLELNGFRVTAQPLHRRTDGDGETFVEKGADIGLATELLARGFTDAYEHAIVVTGDEDFVRPIREVQDQGKTVTVAAFDHQLSTQLQRAADDTVLLDEVAERIRRS